jgi:hypothetical protein
MVHKAEKKKLKTVKTLVTMLFNSIVSTNEGVDVEDFIKNNNEYLAEPKNSDGCIVTFKLVDCELSKQDKMEKKIKQDSSEKLDRYMSFAFRGIKFIVDTEERTVSCSGSGLKSEMISDKNKDGLYSLNVETF